MNVLFVCSRNRWRSPTAERVFRNRSGISVRSAGTTAAARHQVTRADIQWADMVIAMESKHLARLRADFPGEMENQLAHTLDIPDEYVYMDTELIEMLRETIEPILCANG